MTQDSTQGAILKDGSISGEAGEDMVGVNE